MIRLQHHELQNIHSDSIFTAMIRVDPRKSVAKLLGVLCVSMVSFPYVFL